MGLWLLSVLWGFCWACTSVDYSESGANWGGTCASDLQQSPINLSEKEAQNFPHFLFLNYPTMQVLATNDCPDSYSLTLPPATGELIAKDNNTETIGYHSNEVFWHSPSEHLIDGFAFSVEMQIRHSLFAGSSVYTSAVLAVLFNVDADPTDNPFLAQIIDSATSSLYQNVSSFSLSGIISQTTVFAPYYYYQGSMTVPNCTDMFSWYVLTTPQRISTKQLAAFSKKWSLNDTFAGGRGNNRVTQELNSRTLYFNSGASSQTS